MGNIMLILICTPFRRSCVTSLSFAGEFAIPLWFRILKIFHSLQKNLYWFYCSNEVKRKVCSWKAAQHIDTSVLCAAKTTFTLPLNPRFMDFAGDIWDQPVHIVPDNS